MRQRALFPILVFHVVHQALFPTLVYRTLSQAPYLILVISFTLAGFLNPNILHPKITKKTQKLHEIAPKSVTYAVFRFESGNFYTGQNFFTQAPPVVPVTNMRYVNKYKILLNNWEH